MKIQTTYTLDLGNSHPSVAEFANDELITVVPLTDFLSGPRQEQAVYVGSKVRDHLSEQVYDRFEIIWPTNYFTPGQFFDLPVHYAQTLGSDRLVQAYQLYQDFFSTENKNEGRKIQLIDAGTFITIDLVTAQGFQGGHIIPGINLLAESYQRGEKLPPISQAQIKSYFPRRNETPQTTPHAMGLGVWKMLSGFFKEWMEQYQPDLVILTGGQASCLLPLLQELFPSFQIQVRLHLIHESLLTLSKKIATQNQNRIPPKIEETLCPTF